MSNGYCEAWDYLPHGDAEKLAAMKLSRCKRYFLRGGDVHELVQYHDPCKFCFAFSVEGEGDWAIFGDPTLGRWDEKLEVFRGVGCEVCGGTGLFLRRFELPVNFELYTADCPF